MNYLVILLIVSVVISSILGISSSIDDQQELSQLNDDVAEKQMTRMDEKSSITGTFSKSNVNLSNLGNEDISVIQIRVYDDNGKFISAHNINNTISGNSKLNISDLPSDLKKLLGQ